MKAFIKKHTFILSMSFVLMIILLGLLTIKINFPKLSAPAGMRELSEKSNVEWMSGIKAEINNCTQSDYQIKEYIDSYYYTDDEINAKLTFMNGIDEKQPYFFIILCDGIPVEFKVNKDKYVSYSFLLDKELSLDVNFNPEFFLNSGRVDFLLFYNGNKTSDLFLNSYTIWLNSLEQEKDMINLIGTIPQREELLACYKNYTFGAWLWPQNNLSLENNVIGNNELEQNLGDSLLFEAIAATEGKYRTIFIINSQPSGYVNSENTGYYLDWLSTGENMLSIPLKFSQIADGENIFFAISTPMGRDNIDKKCLTSSKNIINVKHGD